MVTTQGHWEDVLAGCVIDSILSDKGAIEGYQESSPVHCVECQVL